MKTIQIQLGQTDNISFPDNAGSTGYQWMLADLPNNVFLVDVDYVAPANPMPGRGGMRIFTIIGAHVGRGKLTFVQVRSWDITNPVQKISYMVDVEAAISPGPVVLYGPALSEARARGDLAEMKALAAKARDALDSQGDIAKALAELEAEIKKAGG